MAILLSLSISAFAANGNIVTIDNVNYREGFEILPDNKIYTVVESPDASGDVVIPDEIDGIPVVSIGRDAFDMNDNITSVTIGNSVKEIGSGAFFDCRSLSQVSFGRGVSVIRADAFSHCQMLVMMKFGNSLSTVERGAFENCRKLKSVTFGTRIGSVDERAFYGCNALQSITLPDNMTPTLSGVRADLEFLPLSEVLRTEVNELQLTYQGLQKEMESIRSQIDEDNAYLRKFDNTASVFGEGNVLFIIVSTVCIAGALTGGIILCKKLSDRKKNADKN